jgi:hypothetical protein
MSAPILSPGMPPARIVHSRTELGAPAALPGIVLEGGPFSIVEFSHGGAQLFDERGHGCGLFVNKQLAEHTAAALGLVLAGREGGSREQEEGSRA